jgi:uncharacterized protein (TIGR03643 family)
MAKPIPRLTPDEIQRIIATAWHDRPPYKAVLQQHGLTPGQVVQLLKRELTPNAYKLWMARGRGSVAPAKAPGRRGAAKAG